MPKQGSDFPDRLEFVVQHETRVQLIALSYLTGSGNTYSVMARNLLAQAITTAVAGLSPPRRKAFEEILGNVEIAEKNKSKKPVVP